MGGKPEAESPEKPPKKKKMTPEEQHALFVKTARELGGDEVSEEFERAFDKIVHSGRATRATRKPDRS